jgi:hypothetical protein
MLHQRFNRAGELISGCGGRVFVDRAHSDDRFLELACIECGKRWNLDGNNRFAAHLLLKEQVRLNAGGM